jgi:hypothetical protein
MNRFTGERVVPIDRPDLLVQKKWRRFLYQSLAGR